MISSFILVIGLKRSHTAKPSNAGGTMQSLCNGMGGCGTVVPKALSLAPECPVCVDEVAILPGPWSLVIRVFKPRVVSFNLQENAKILPMCHLAYAQELIETKPITPHHFEWRATDSNECLYHAALSNSHARHCTWPSAI